MGDEPERVDLVLTEPERTAGRIEVHTAPTACDALDRLERQNERLNEFTGVVSHDSGIR
ncbi:hypothetical protein [Natrinema gelatinilyticum]|uniref:hypothetical protein n=1 Tax=Natrinema gelatinilyticum TaxID=2961571 RepID=UPI0020C29740|nr:hypothetical protein [Natrinema gelatinilyticum]